jgi:hypothetical protein
MSEYENQLYYRINIHDNHNAKTKFVNEWQKIVSPSISAFRLIQYTGNPFQ